VQSFSEIKILANHNVVRTVLLWMCTSCPLPYTVILLIFIFRVLVIFPVTFSAYVYSDCIIVFSHLKNVYCPVLGSRHDLFRNVYVRFSTLVSLWVTQLNTLLVLEMQSVAEMVLTCETDFCTKLRYSYYVSCMKE